MSMHKLLLLQVLLLTCADTQLSDIDCGCTGQLADAEKVDTNVFDSLGASYSAADAASDAQLDLQQLLHVKHGRLHTARAVDPARPTRFACVTRNASDAPRICRDARAPLVGHLAGTRAPVRRPGD